jgi:hypothetical protein
MKSPIAVDHLAGAARSELVIALDIVSTRERLTPRLVEEVDMCRGIL